MHLGSRGAQAEMINDFLKNHSCENLFLVGDIVDFWALKRKSYFPESHTEVLRRILKKSNNGTKVTYVIGNHDEYLRNLLPLSFGEIAFADETSYTAGDGKRYLIVHGDRFDQVVKYAKWLAWLGDVGYEFLLRSNNVVKYVRRKLGFPGFWSLSAAVKYHVKGAVSFIGSYEDAVVKTVIDSEYSGIICGHIHSAEIREMNGITYCNTGDWVESCTAIVEHDDGTLHLIRWAEERGRKKIGTDIMEMAEACL